MAKDRTPKDYAYVGLTGMTMGAADVVPGVSGGTMAFIMGIYQELIQAIKSFDVELAKKALRFDVKGVLDHIPWRFLLALGIGIGLSVVTLAHAVTYMLENHQNLLYAFFFGLVAASIVAIGRDVQWSVRTFLALVAGTLAAYWIVGLVPSNAPNTPLILFLSGTVAISAMILPGISGSFILLILGQYAYVISAVKDLDVITLLPLALGCGLGLMAFARILSWLFAHYEQITMTLLVGFMLGSLRKIWPFKVTLETMIDRHGEEVPILEKNVLPDFSTSEPWIALGLAVVGFLLILGLNRLRYREGVA